MNNDRLLRFPGNSHQYRKRRREYERRMRTPSPKVHWLDMTGLPSPVPDPKRFDHLAEPEHG